MDIGGAGAAGMFMTAGQAGMDAFTAPQQRKRSRQIMRLQDENRNLEHGLQDRQLGQQEADVNRGAYFQGQAQDSADLVGRGLSRTSSITNQDQNTIEQDRQRRYNAIQDERNTANQTFNNQSQIIYHQRAQAKMARNLALVNSLIQGGAGGAVEHYGSA